MADTKPYSVEHVLNQSFDPTAQILRTGAVVYNPDTGLPETMVQPATGFRINGYDYFEKVATNATTDTITYKTGGASGTTIATLTIVYTDSTKTDVASITKA